MTVAELIAELQKLDASLPVVYRSGAHDDLYALLKPEVIDAPHYAVEPFDCDNPRRTIRAVLV